jgi:hypothetical protein
VIAHLSEWKRVADKSDMLIRRSRCRLSFARSAETLTHAVFLQACETTRWYYYKITLPGDLKGEVR